MSTKPQPVKASSPDEKAGHPHRPHDNDLVAVEVLHAQGVHFGGHTYRPGETLVMPRARAVADEPGKRPVRVLKTVRYVHGPSSQTEEAIEQGPLDLDQEQP